MCTVVLSFLPYTTGKQQLDLKMLKIRHFRSINRYRRENNVLDPVYLDKRSYLRNCRIVYDTIGEMTGKFQTVYKDNRQYLTLITNTGESIEIDPNRIVDISWISPDKHVISKMMAKQVEEGGKIPANHD